MDMKNSMFVKGFLATNILQLKEKSHAWCIFSAIAYHLSLLKWGVAKMQNIYNCILTNVGRIQKDSCSSDIFNCWYFFKCILSVKVAEEAVLFKKNLLITKVFLVYGLTYDLQCSNTNVTFTYKKMYLRLVKLHFSYFPFVCILNKIKLFKLKVSRLHCSNITSVRI